MNYESDFLFRMKWTLSNRCIAYKLREPEENDGRLKPGQPVFYTKFKSDSVD
jgi:hypothetical protein